MLYSLIYFVCWYRFVHTFVELEEVYSNWVPNFQYEQFIFHKMLIIFIAYVNDPFIPSAFPFHWCVYLLSTAPLLYRRDKRRTGQKKRPNRGTNQWLPMFSVWQCASHNCYQLDRKKNWARGIEIRLFNDSWWFGLNFICRYETVWHVRTERMKHMYLIVWLLSDTLCCTCSLPVLCLLHWLRRGSFLVWTKGTACCVYEACTEYICLTVTIMWERLLFILLLCLWLYSFIVRMRLRVVGWSCIEE